MFYENELRLLCDTFKKCHVCAASARLDAAVKDIINTDLYSFFGDDARGDVTFAEYFGDVEEQTVYKYTDALGHCYIYLLLPSAKSQILVIGPYLNAHRSVQDILELGEKLGVPPKAMNYFKEYCQSIPTLADGNSLFVMLDAFCERIWQVPSFSVVDINKDIKSPVSPINESSHSDSFDDVLANMKAMENRYAFENELMRAVSLGQSYKDTVLFSMLGEDTVEKRVADPVRNIKNYSIIMNTLLRKAAENGGVHPVYLNKVSSEIAAKIEQLASSSEGNELMREIFNAYCRLVRKHSMKKYSPVVQKTILLIDSDLAADLSLSSLALNQNISAGYLSSVFKKETGKTVSEYIREKRMRHAAHLLSTTHLQIQTVALHCGIMDVQYFSKMFKKQIGKTPKEYRESIKR